MKKTEKPIDGEAIENATNVAVRRMVDANYLPGVGSAVFNDERPEDGCTIYLRGHFTASMLCKLLSAVSAVNYDFGLVKMMPKEK